VKVTTRLIGHTDVRRLLPMQDAIPVVRAALIAYARGEVVQPLRQVVMAPGEGLRALALMPAVVGDAMGAKAFSVFSGNAGTPLETHQGVLLLFNHADGRLLAIIDAATVTEIRTAAASAAATDVLAGEDAGSLAVLGSGTQARAHVEAMRAVRRLREVRVWSRDASHARRFADWVGRQGLAARLFPTAHDAAFGADLICTVTGARDPILDAADVAPGAHVNAVGASVPSYRELSSALVKRGRLFVDSRQSALAEADDVRIPLGEHAILPSHVQGEIGEVLAGDIPGRTSAEELTIFKSLGLAVEDVATAAHLYRAAEAAGVGEDIEITGTRPG